MTSGMGITKESQEALVVKLIAGFGGYHDHHFSGKETEPSPSLSFIIGKPNRNQSLLAHSIYSSHLVGWPRAGRGS